MKGFLVFKKIENYEKLKEQHDEKVTEFNNLWKTLGETTSQIYEVQGHVTDIKETVSNITESLKVPTNMITNLSEDLGIQEEQECDYVAAMSIYMKSHVKKPTHRFTCDKCNKMFPDMKERVAHKKSSHVGTSKLYACTECDAKFTAVYAFQQHSKTAHKHKMVQ